MYLWFFKKFCNWIWSFYFSFCMYLWFLKKFWIRIRSLFRNTVWFSIQTDKICFSNSVNSQSELIRIGIHAQQCCASMSETKVLTVVSLLWIRIRSVCRIQSDPKLFGQLLSQIQNNWSRSDFFNNKIWIFFLQNNPVLLWFIHAGFCLENATTGMHTWIFKICQLFSWSSFKDRIRILIPTKSFRVHING